MSSNDSHCENAGRRLGGKYVRRALLSLAWTLLFLVVAIIVPAGDIRWWNGWLFIVVFVVLTILSVVYLHHTNPEIFAARSKIHAGTKPWDKVLVALILLSFFAIFPAAGTRPPVPRVSHADWDNRPRLCTFRGRVCHVDLGLPREQVCRTQRSHSDRSGTQGHRHGTVCHRSASALPCQLHLVRWDSFGVGIALGLFAGGGRRRRPRHPNGFGRQNAPK